MTTPVPSTLVEVSGSRVKRKTAIAAGLIVMEMLTGCGGKGSESLTCLPNSKGVVNMKDPFSKRVTVSSTGKAGVTDVKVHGGLAGRARESITTTSTTAFQEEPKETDKGDGVEMHLLAKDNAGAIGVSGKDDYGDPWSLEIQLSTSGLLSVSTPTPHRGSLDSSKCL